MRHIKFFHQFSYFVLPRWLRRKLKRWRSGFVRLPGVAKKIALATVLVVGAFLGGKSQEATAQNVTNSWSHNGYNNGVNTHTITTSGTWWGNGGTGTTPNIISALTGGSTDRTVNVSFTTAQSCPEVGHWSGGSPSTWVVDHNADTVYWPTGNKNPYIHNNSATTGTVSITGGTTRLTTYFNPANYFGAGEHFTIDYLTKTGAGALSLEIQNLEIVNFTGNQGTLNLGNSGTGVLATGTLTSTTASFTAGTGATQNLSVTNPGIYHGPVISVGAGANTLANFSFTSGGPTGAATAANKWTISNPITNSNGINIMGYMDVGGGVNSMNGATNIGIRGSDGLGNTDKNGILNLAGGLNIGTTATDNNFLNINRSNSVLTVGGPFQAGTIPGASGAINHLWGGTFQTKAGSSVGQAAGSVFTANVSNGTWNNAADTSTAALIASTGQHMSIGQSGTGTLNVFTGNNGQYNNTGGAGIVNTGEIIFAETGTGSRGYGNIYGTGSKLNVTAGDMTVGQSGTAVVSVFNNGVVDIQNGNLYVSDKSGSDGTLDIFGGGKTYVKKVGANTGNAYIADERGTNGYVNVHGTGSLLDVAENLYTGYDSSGTAVGTTYAQGNLYAWGGAKVTVGKDHIIADGKNALGRDYIDMSGTRMEVTGNLIVGNYGQAGGTYTDDRSSNRYDQTPDPANGDWLGGWNGTFGSRTALGSITNAKTGNDTGNDPGLAITRGGYVISKTGQVAVEDDSNGYVVIDNNSNTLGAGIAAHSYNPLGTVYDWEKNQRPFYLLTENEVNNDSYVSETASVWVVKEKLEVGVNGNAFQRVLNGGTLITGKDWANGKAPTGQGDSTVITSGTGVGQLVVSGNNPYYGRSVLKSYGATVVGLDANGRGIFKVLDGAFTETAGLYLGVGDATAGGEVLLDGPATTLRIMADNGSPNYIGDDPALGSGSNLYEHLLNDTTGTNNIATRAGNILGEGTFGASHGTLVWMDADSLVQLNGMTSFASGSVLHLDNKYKVGEVNGVFPTSQANPFGVTDKSHNPLFDAGLYRVDFTNARVEGIGHVTGAGGVHINQSPAAPDATLGQAYIDPGLIYGWETKCEKDFFGDLYFGHTLSMTGNVITLFDVDAGYYNFATGENNYRSQDNIFVIADPSVGTDVAVKATLSGTLSIHPRLSDYYTAKNIERYAIVTTIPTDDGGTMMPGVITRGYDNLDIKAKMFFTGQEQEIDRVMIYMDNLTGKYTVDEFDTAGNANTPYGESDVLFATMTPRTDPFENAAHTYNEKSLGRVLDSIYALEDRVWLPFLRGFWYQPDEEAFLNEYRLYGGEIRAHSMVMPLQNPWRYAFDRNGFSRCTGHVFFGPQNRSSNITTGNGLWGAYILSGNETGSDGNAGAYNIKRKGFVLGYEKAKKGGNSYVGAMFAFNQSELEADRSDAKADDFQVGLYHGKRVFNTWEWKNYLGMGVQNYDMNRYINMSVGESIWKTSPQGNAVFKCNDIYSSGQMHSNFMGLTFAGSTELGRPFYYGKCRQWTVRPYVGLDVATVWQNKASEYGELYEVDENTGELGPDTYYEVNGERYRAADLAQLDYYSTTNTRIFGRPGIEIQRGGSNGNIHAGVAYSFLMGGHRYTRVTNQFQFAGDKFDLRGVDDGSGFVTANVGISAYFGKRKLNMVSLDYAVMGGSHSTTHAGQLGIQRHF